jgi:hypothetical protein
MAALRLVLMLEKASPWPIKGLLFTNPHNLFGRFDHSEIILEVIKF